MAYFVCFILYPHYTYIFSNFVRLFFDLTHVELVKIPTFKTVFCWRFLNHAKYLSEQKKNDLLQMFRKNNVEICQTFQTFEEPFKSFTKTNHANSKDVAFPLHQLAGRGSAGRV